MNEDGMEAVLTDGTCLTPGLSGTASAGTDTNLPLSLGIPAVTFGLYR